MILGRITLLPLFTSLILSGFWYHGGGLTALLLLLTATVGFRSGFARHIWQNYALSKLTLLYLVWLITITIISATATTSLMMLAVLTGLPVMYLVATNTPWFGELWRYLRSGIIFSGTSLAAWGLWHAVVYSGYDWPMEQLLDRNAFAILMSLLWFPAAYLYLSHHQTHGKTILLGTCLFVIGMALFATSSRTSLASWLLLFPLFLWSGWRYTKAKWWVASLALITFFAYVASASLNVMQYSQASDINTHIGTRLMLWQSAVQMVLAHPLTGTGLGTFTTFYPSFRSPLENTTNGAFALNDYLQLATEGGIPALLLLLAMLPGIAWQLRRSLKLSHTSAGFESSALLSGVLTIFIHASLSPIFYLSFVNILAGLYLARAAQLTDMPRIVSLPSFNHISRPIKRLVTGFIVLLIATPFCLHMLAQACLTGTQPGLKAIHLITPNVTTYQIAKLITAIRPQEIIAQEIMLQTAEQTLTAGAGIETTRGNFQRGLLNEALEHFDLARKKTANIPDIGAREANILITHHASLDDGIAYTKAHQILSDNLKADPYHADSLIALARLQVAEGHRNDAFYTLQRAEHRVLTRRDQQLVSVETLRQLAAPRIIPELDNIEKQLRQVRSDSETGKPLILAPHFSEDIDKRLQTIAAQIQTPH